MLQRIRTVRWLGWTIAVAMGMAVEAPATDDEVGSAIATIKAVGREGDSNDSAAVAWKVLVKQGSPALMPTLEAIDDANATASNWLRTAVDAIAEAERNAGRPLPTDKLEAFVKDLKRAPTARRLAFSLLVAQDQTAKDRFLPGFLNDPSQDLRRDAVAAELDKIEKATRPSAKDDLTRLLTFARDRDQVELIAQKLETDYKAKVNRTEHFGFLTHWHLIGPFDSAQGKALTVKHPPEEQVDVSKKIKGKSGADLAWVFHVTHDKYGMVDVNKVLGAQHDAAAYAAATVVADKDGPSEIRVATPNALQIFVNGKKVFEREEYHHGAEPDHNVGKCSLNAGPNLIVLKICQNNQKEPHAQHWMFQARVCDATGAPIPGVAQLVPEGDKLKSIKLGFIPESADKKETKQ
jgi:hypothetical protein